MIDLDRIADKTRGGYPVKIAAVNPKAIEGSEIIAWVLISDCWEVRMWHISGRYDHLYTDNHKLDLIEIPEYKEGQVWHYENTLYFVRASTRQGLYVTTNKPGLYNHEHIPETATLVFDPDEKGIKL